MKKLFLLAALFVAAAFSSCSKHDNVEPVVDPELQPLAIAFAEGNSLEFAAGETKIVHYTITGGNDNNVVKAELQNSDGAYALSTTPISATEGTITITAKTPTDNRVIVSVSDGSQTVTAEIAVSTKSSSSGITITVETPGTLAELLAGYDKTKITELTVIGNLNDKDIATLKSLPNLAILDMEHVNLETLPQNAFNHKKSLTSVKLPLTLKTIGYSAFEGCSSLTSVTIPDSVTEIGYEAFCECSSLASVTIPDSVTTIGYTAFANCHSLTSIMIPDSVTEIEEETFSCCSGLTSVTIGNNVTTIGNNAFDGCTGLTSVTIPNSVTSIGNYVFADCSGLTSIYCTAQTPPTIKSSTFTGVATSTPLYVPIGSADAYRTADNWKNFTNINEMEF